MVCTVVSTYVWNTGEYLSRIRIQVIDANQRDMILTEAAQIAKLWLSWTFCLVPSLASTVRAIRHIKIQLATATLGPWLMAVITPCGGKVPPFP